MAMWEGHTVAEFAETLLYLLEVKGQPYKIGAVLAGLSENDVEMIQKRLRYKRFSRIIPAPKMPR